MHNAPSAEWVGKKLAEVTSQSSRDLSAQFAEVPRLPETLWFIEWRCRQPGGLEAFARDFVKHAGEAILPKEFWGRSIDKQDRFSPDDVFAVWQKLPAWARPRPPAALRDAVDMVEAGAVTDASMAAEAGLTKPIVEGIRGWLTRAACIEACRSEAIERLPGVLSDFFYFQGIPFPDSLCPSGWQKPSGMAPYKLLSNLPCLLISYMDFHAAAERAKVADTKVTGLVFEAVEYASDSSSLVIVTGESRYGKTESLTVWCNAYPGKVRLVRTPSTGGEKMFLLRIAQGIGFAFDEGSSVAKIREAVCFALRNGAPTLIFDESNFLLPANYTLTTPPSRLNFIRTEIVDAGRGCVLSATPQAHRDSLDKYVKKTHYAMEQWLGRIDMVYNLPNNFSIDDMMKVARFRLPGLSDTATRLIVSRGMATDQFLHALTSIGKRALWLASKAGRSEPTPEEISAAADAFMQGVYGEIKSVNRERPQLSPRTGRRGFTPGQCSVRDQVQPTSGSRHAGGQDLISTMPSGYAHCGPRAELNASNEQSE